MDNEVSREYTEPRKILDPDRLCAALEEDGAVARRLPGYERRDPQLGLVRLIAGAFNGGGVAVAEAGTGVGKSFAYLLPAAEFALSNNERIIISTATITLQQQLFEKDIPLVLKALGKNLKCILVKGRGNYLCRRRLTETLLEPPLDDGEYEDLRSAAAWAEQTRTGSRSDLPFPLSPGLWSRLCGEGDTCLGMHCPEKERCFFLALRREAAESRILVVNHHLLFADLAARHSGAGYEASVVLPPYTRIIIDEAHTIEDAATSFFSGEWSSPGINRALSRLYRKRRTRESGLLLRLAAAFPASVEGPLPPGIFKALAAVREAAEKADAAALSLCAEEGFFRLVPGREDAEDLLFPPLKEMRKVTASLAETVRSMTEQADPEDPAVREIRAILRRLESAAAICGSFLEYRKKGGASPGEEVYWVERREGSQRDPWAVFSAAPVDIAPLLGEALFNANKTVVCVSATLTTGESPDTFRFWVDRTGAARTDRGFLRGIFPSPFPYGERTLLAVPADAPLPDSPEYPDFVPQAVTGLVQISGGSALVLFTSYQSLRSTFDAAAPVLEEQGIRCLKQGDGDRSRLLSEFLADTKSVLFGTDSFWEGVDAPGDTLRLVILCRLPFRTLRDPVFEARREFLESRGRNSFAELSLPDAVMKFKQGFGRLIRCSQDHGAVAVLDGRILRKYYGKAFLQALPRTKTSFKNLPGVLEDMERFLY